MLLIYWTMEMTSNRFELIRNDTAAAKSKSKLVQDSFRIQRMNDASRILQRS
jgi:hypothetical protein